MNSSFPTLEDFGFRIPPTLRAGRFTRGFDYAMRGGQLDKVEYFRLSFRLGYRHAKLCLREIRRQRGILDFPLRARVRQKAIW